MKTKSERLRAYAAAPLAWMLAMGWVLAPASARAADPFLRRTPTVAVVERVGPAVVNIITEHVVQQQSPFRRRGVDPFFDRYFQDFGEPRARRTVQSLGSGVIISREGHVLTNEHVVARASRIRVALGDGREFEVTVVGADPSNDIAVLKIDTQEKLPWLLPGDSSDIMVGEPVIAIGNPFGLSNTVTTGVVSALDRSVRSNEHSFHGFIQTDASINPGNSGGPLLNAEGTLIGINSAIYNGAEGIGFAIPINTAQRVVAELIEHGEVLPVTLGIDFQDLDPALREVMELPKGVVGALINRVHPGGPADRAGMRRGDVLARFDGKRIESARQLFELLESVTPNQKLSVELLRENRSVEVEVVAEEIPDNVEEKLASRFLGLNLEANPKGGYAVTNVRRGSSSELIGIAPGDVILGINGVPLRNQQDLRKAMLNLRSRDRALVVVLRGAGRYYVTIPLK